MCSITEVMSRDDSNSCTSIATLASPRALIVGSKSVSETDGSAAMSSGKLPSKANDRMALLSCCGSVVVAMLVAFGGL